MRFNQDGFAYRAVKVWTDDAEPSDRDRAENGSAGHQSRLTLTFDIPVTDDNSETQA
jgi:CspA family cold shock protein